MPHFYTRFPYREIIVLQVLSIVCEVTFHFYHEQLFYV